MAKVFIGVDPHKLSATIEVVDDRETILAKGRFATDKSGYAAMRKTVSGWPDRVWAVEGSNGAGRPLAHEAQVGVFNACGVGCHIRTVTFADGSTLVLRTVDQPGSFAFTSPGGSGSHGYNSAGLPGNPNFLDITETVIGGTGTFAGATGEGTGTVKVAGGVAIGKTTGTITLPGTHR